MSLSITARRSFEISASLSSFYLEAFGLCLFASFDRPAGSPWLEVSRWELGGGWRLLLGPLLVEAGRSAP